jgi:integrase/recombinase XerD
VHNELLVKFEAYLLTEKCVSRNTFSAYKADVANFVQFLQKSNTLVEHATDIHVKHYLRTLKESHLTARSMSRKISSLKLFFRYLKEHVGYKNIMDLVSFPKAEKKLPRYLSEAEVDILLEVANRNQTYLGTRNKVMLYLLYVTGMRISELVHIAINDIHFDTGFVSITGKGGKGRMVPLPEPMVLLLQHYLTHVHRIFSAKKEKTNYLFPTCYRGLIKPITRQSFWIILKKIWQKTGIKQSLSPHKLRHSFATHMLKRGANLRSLQLLLGHENLTTVQIYTHLETSYLRQIYDKKHPRS